MIKLIKSTFYHEQETKNRLCKFISASSQLSFGPECEQFENQFARWQGRKYAVLVTSGSMSNLAVLQAIKNLGMVNTGDRIGFSSVTWSTNIMPIIQLGCNPIPVDIDGNTLNISSENLEETIGKTGISVLFLTHLLGFCSDPDRIRAICNKNNILLIEDTCESIGSVYKGTKLGNFGFASTFSFYVGHQLSTIEGGMVVTDDPELADMLRIVRAHGWDRNLDREGKNAIRKKHSINTEFYSRYAFYDLGYNMRPTEITGFLGSQQLKHIDEIIKKREKNFRYLAKHIYCHTERFRPLEFLHMDRISNFGFPVLCRTKQICDDIVRRCRSRVEIRPILGGNIIHQPFYGKYVKEHIRSSTQAEIIHNTGLYCGNNPDMTIKDLDALIRVFV